MTEEERTILSERQKSEILQLMEDKDYKFMGKPTIKEPSEVSYKIDKPIDKEIIIKRSILSYFKYFFGTALICVLVIPVIISSANSSLKVWICFCCLVLLAVMVYAFKRDFKIVKTITINNIGISGDDIAVAWPDISGIFITTYYNSGRTSIDILWLALKDGNYQEFNISSYPYNDIGHTIAHYIYAYDPMGSKTS